jgi:acetyl esterase/lipase
MLMALPNTPSSFTLLPAIQYGEAADMLPWNAQLFMDMLCPYPLPSNPAPAIIYIHGGGWSEGTRSAGLYPWLNPLLAAHGFITISITYRLSGLAPFPAQIHDAKAAVRWLRAHAEEYHIDAERIGVWGDSAGGHLAALLGVTGDVPELEGNNGSAGYSSGVQAVIARCAPYDFLRPGGQLINDAPSPVTQLFGGTVAEYGELMRAASPIAHVHSSIPAFQIVHGTLDETVPFEQAEHFVSALKEVGGKVEFFPIQETYHNLRSEEYAPWTDEPWEELGWKALSFFQQHLS